MGWKLPPVYKLVLIASAGGMIIGISGHTMNRLTYRSLKKSDYYHLAMVNILAHKPLVNYLGEPLGFGEPDLSGSSSHHNYSTGSELSFVIPLTGSRTSGNIYYEASRDPNDDNSRWTVETLQVEVEDRKPDRIVVPIRFPTTESIPNFRGRALPE